MALDWWHGDEIGASRTTAFASTSDGSLFALWRHDDRPLDRAPVVYLDCDVSGSRIVAGNVRDFLALLAVGWDEDFNPVWHASFSDAKKQDAVAEDLRAFLRSVRIAPASDPDALVGAAHLGHPDLLAWLQAMRK